MSKYLRTDNKLFDFFFNLEKLSKFSFLLIFFFTLFPTGIPFSDEKMELGEIGTSNFLNQVVFVLGFIISSISLLPKANLFVNYFKNNLVFTFFLLWCLISVFWSDYSFVSFKRYFQLFTVCLVITAAFINCKRMSLIKIMVVVILLYIIVTFVSVILIKGAIDPDFGTWRGLTPQKNNFGQVGVVLFLFSLYFLKILDNKSYKNISLLILISSIIFIIMSFSSTSFIAFFVSLSLMSIYYFDKMFHHLGINRLLSTTLLISLIFILIILINYSSEIFSYFPDLFGKDLTFTGRTLLWADQFTEVQKHFFIGCGFDGFWVMDSERIRIFSEYFGWIAINGQNGYLDLLNEIGLVGLTLFILLIINFIILSIRSTDNVKFVLIITLLILNFTETVLVRSRSLVTFAFFYSYIEISLTKYLDRNKNIVDRKVNN